MTGYNRVNGTLLHRTRRAAQDILRGEWGFEGFVVTDWFGAAPRRAPRARASIWRCPARAAFFGAALAAAVRNGRVDEAVLDGMVRRFLGVLDRLGALDDVGPHEITSIDRPEHRALAREASAGLDDAAEATRACCHSTGPRSARWPCADPTRSARR